MTKRGKRTDKKKRKPDMIKGRKTMKRSQRLNKNNCM
jgi:hypothetical protein